MRCIVHTVAIGLSGLIYFSAAGGSARLSLSIGHPPTLVAGLPMPLELRVEGEGRFVAVGILENFNPSDIQLLSSANEEYRFHARLTVEVPPTVPAFNPERDNLILPVPKVKISPDEANSFVLDLSNLEINVRIAKGIRTAVSPDQLQAGEYQIVVDVPGMSVTVDSEQKSITLVEPNPEERKLLDRVYGLVPRGSVWRSFVTHADEILSGIQIDKLSELAQRQMQYHLLLARLVHSDSDIADLTILDGDVEGLWLVYQTDVLMLRYEIDMAAGRVSEAEALRVLILLTRPTARYHLDAMESRGGLIAGLRGNLSRAH